MKIFKAKECSIDSKIIKFVPIQELAQEDLIFDQLLFDIERSCDLETILSGYKISSALEELENWERDSSLKIVK